MTETTPKFRIYQGIACLETTSPPSVHGGWWWDQGYQLGYRPYPIRNIRRIRVGILQGTGREVIAVDVHGQWIALNPARSDIPALTAAGIWPPHMAKPYTLPPAYHSWPEEIS